MNVAITHVGKHGPLQDFENYGAEYKARGNGEYTVGYIA